MQRAKKEKEVPSKLNKSQSKEKGDLIRDITKKGNGQALDLLVLPS